MEVSRKLPLLSHHHLCHHAWHALDDVYGSGWADMTTLHWGFVFRACFPPVRIQSRQVRSVCPPDNALGEPFNVYWQQSIGTCLVEAWCTTVALSCMSTAASMSIQSPLLSKSRSAFTGDLQCGVLSRRRKRGLPVQYQQRAAVHERVSSQSCLGQVTEMATVAQSRMTSKPNFGTILRHSPPSGVVLGAIEAHQVIFKSPGLSKRGHKPREARNTAVVC